MRDQLPVSQDEKINIEGLHIVPAENPEKDKDALPNGAVEWKIELPAKETAKLELGFTVAYPKDLRVDGLH